MRNQSRLWSFALLTLGLLAPTPAYAHHEAIFGPQSSAVLSAGRFASAQVFTRDTGTTEERMRQTTTVFSAGMQPFKRPVSVAVVVPLSFVDNASGGGTRSGFEDALVSVRYRAESEPFTEALGMEETYFMGVGGIELPTGTLEP